MPITDSPAPDKGVGYLSGNRPVTLFSLNEVLNECIRKMHASAHPHDVVFRCDLLPTVSGNRDEMCHLFDSLIALISGRHVKGSKLFLHIECYSPGSEKKSSQDGEFRKFQIKFCTNILATKEWEKQNEQEIIACSKILEAHNGTLQINILNPSGCLFCVTMPGKLQ